MVSARQSGGSSGEKQVLFQLLIEMNKLKNEEFDDVWVICCTNDPNGLDIAIRRSVTHYLISNLKLLFSKVT